jgi:hypothetical protein
MPATSLPRIPMPSFGEGTDLEAIKQQIINTIITINQALDELDWLLGGAIDSKNAKEFGGWIVGLTELQSKDKKVGMSTNKNGTDPVRFWAGDVINGNPNFKVTAAGILTAVAATLLSAAGYPRVEINSQNNLIKASTDATHYLAISPFLVNGAPTITFQDPNTHADMYLAGDANETFVINNSAGNTQVGAQNGDLSLVCGSNKSVKVNQWSQVKNTTTGRTLQQDLDAKANGSGVGGLFYVATSPGGSPTTALQFVNGVLTSHT